MSRSKRPPPEQMSLFDPGSALSRLNRDGELRGPPGDLLAVLRLAQWVARQSGGGTRFGARETER